MVSSIHLDGKTGEIVNAALPRIAAVLFLLILSSSNRVHADEPMQTEFLQVPLDYDRTLMVAKAETTVAEWRMCVDAGVCEDLAEPDSLADHPMVNVNYEDVSRYLHWRNQSSAQPLRLPSQGEWLAFALEHGPKPVNNPFTDPRMAWASGYNLDAGPLNSKTEAVGSFGVNQRGLKDLRGNVWEWTESCATQQLVASSGPSGRSFCAGGRLALGEHTASVNELVRFPAKAGCGGGQPPANIGFRVVYEVDGKAAMDKSKVFAQAEPIDFELTGADVPVRLSDYRGDFVAVFFGFTSCGGVCPMSLGLMGSAVAGLPQELQDKLHILFVSVDPKRDDADTVEKYVAGFPGGVEGASGTESELLVAASSLGSEFKVPDNAEGFYMVEHSSNFYVVGPDGRLVNILPGDLTAKKMRQALLDMLG